MEDESIKDKKVELPKKAYELLSWAEKGGDVTVRDDQHEFSCLLDSVKICRQSGCRFRLIDSGKFDRFQLEWLAEAGADLYTSDEARAEASELELVNRACKKGGAIVAYFHHRPLESEEESSSVSFSNLKDMGRSGIYLYLSNRERKREISQLNELAYACRKGGSWLVYYLHGSLKSPLEDLAKNGAWIHISDQSFEALEDPTLVLDKVRSTISAGARLILHVEKGLDFSLLCDVIKTGVYVLFKSSLFDYKSPFRTLERKARKRKLDFRAYYLYPTFLP